MLRVNNLKSAFRKRNRKVSYTINNEKKSLTIVDSISFRDRCALITSIADMILSEGAYFAYAEDFAYGFFFLSYLTDCEIPEDSDDIWNIIQATNITKRVNLALSVNNSFVDSIKRDVNALLDFRKAEHFSNTKAGEFYAALTDLVSKLDSIIGDDDISASEVLSVAKKIASKDEDKIVQEVLSFKRDNDSDK